MRTCLDALPAVSRVAVVRLRSLGDCVLTTPALHLLKRHRPDVRVAVVVEPRFAAVFEGNPDVERVLAPSVADVARWRPALSVNLHGGTRSLVLTVASLARVRAGFAHYRHAAAYNVRLPRAQEVLGVERTVHTAEHIASAMFHLGVPLAEVPRARLFPSRPAAEEEPYAVIHPFASHPDKAWPADRFRAIAEHVERSLGLRPLFIGGAADDFSPFSKEQVCPGGSLAATKCLLSGASLFVGNDSGPAHMAAAFGVPVVVLYGTSDPVVWAPWRTASQTLVANGPVSRIDVAQALDAIERLGVAA